MGIDTVLEEREPKGGKYFFEERVRWGKLRILGWTRNC
jgi:hypothetical protein